MPTPSNPASSRLPTETPQRGASPLQWYMLGAAVWATVLTIVEVLLSWLVVDTLQAEARWVGIVQAAVLIPSFFLILLGGTVADRNDCRTLLIRLYLSSGLLVFGLVAVILLGWLSIPVLVLFAAAQGSINAFVFPARDSLISEVAGENLMRAVIWLGLIHWGMQTIGSLFAAAAGWTGIVPMLIVAGLLLLIPGTEAFRRLAPAPPHPDAEREKMRLEHLLGGLKEALRTPALLPTFWLTLAAGTFFVASFLVIFPVLVRDIYHGDVDQVGLLRMMFPIGIILGSFGMLKAHIERKGRAQLVSLFFGSFCLASLALQPPFWGVSIIVILWGIGAAVFIHTGRTIFQEHASDRQRARVLAVLNLSLMGSAGLIGAPLTGFLIDWLGPLLTCAVNGGAMLIIALVTALSTDVAKVE